MQPIAELIYEQIMLTSTANTTGCLILVGVEVTKMAQPKPERLSFDQVLKLVDQLTPDERSQLRRRLDFKSWDDEWNKLKQELAEVRAAQGLPPPTDEDIHDEIDARRTPEEWEHLRREVQKGIDQLDRGEGVPGEQVFAELRERNQAFRKTDKN